jgi:uncharacterized protein (DUF433 family)
MKQYISSNPKIMGGVPCITGTRIPISVILYRLKDGHSIEDINDMYPWVDQNTLEGAIDEAIKHFTTTAHA